MFYRIYNPRLKVCATQGQSNAQTASFGAQLNRLLQLLRNSIGASRCCWNLPAQCCFVRPAQIDIQHRGAVAQAATAGIMPKLAVKLFVMKVEIGLGPRD